MDTLTAWLVAILGTAGILLAISVFLTLLDWWDELDEKKALRKQAAELRTICEPPSEPPESTISLAAVYLLVTYGEQDPDERGYWIARAMNCAHSENARG